MKIKSEILPTLVKLARQQNYRQAEGFADANLTLMLSDEDRQKMDGMADELSRAACVSQNVALSTLVNLAAHKVIAAYVAGDLANGVAGWAERERVRAN